MHAYKTLHTAAYVKIRTHGSELRGQERAKRIIKNKLLCVFYMSKRFL